MVSLRQRNRINAMRLTQRTAVEMFIADGFGAVTVEEIAAEVGMAASTIYRHFDTKESIVLWDEHDPAIDEALERHLGNLAPFEAVRTAFVEAIGGRYTEDMAFQLRRVGFIYATKELHAAGIEADFRAREELTEGLRHFLPRKQKSAAPIIAGAAMLALDVAMDQWQANKGKVPLRDLLETAFDQLRSLDTLG